MVKKVNRPLEDESKRLADEAAKRLRERMLPVLDQWRVESSERQQAREILQRAEERKQRRLAVEVASQLKSTQVAPLEKRSGSPRLYDYEAIRNVAKEALLIGRDDHEAWFFERVRGLCGEVGIKTPKSDKTMRRIVDGLFRVKGHK